jgi:hypothetical protein
MTKDQKEEQMPNAPAAPWYADRDGRLYADEAHTTPVGLKLEGRQDGDVVRLVMIRDLDAVPGAALRVPVR